MNVLKNKLILALLVIYIPVFAQTTFTSKNDVKSIAKFESEAPLETIIGIGNKVDVSLSINIKDITVSPKGTVIVDLNSLKTGIEMRDKDMREKFLETDKFANALFNLSEFTSVSSKELVDGIRNKASAKGKLTIHGVTKEISAPVTLYYFKDSERTKNRLKGNLLSVSTVFTIKLSDYGITVPEILFYKLEDSLTISVSFIASDSEQ